MTGGTRRAGHIHPLPIVNRPSATIIHTDKIAFHGAFLHQPAAAQGFDSMIDIRFPTALQMMLSLALAQQEAVPQMSSSQLAQSLGANPSLVRKLLVPLVQDKLVDSIMGKSGGVRLARTPDKITLRDIYRSIFMDKKIWTPRTGIPHRCLVSSNVQGYFEELIDDAEEAVHSTLGRHTLLQALTELQRRASLAKTPRKAKQARLSRR
jgi:Rrf2 family transcriptional regulator, repressor of oqxAB